MSDMGGLKPAVKPSSKLPWIKFYPTDWRADPGMRACSLAARGLWIEMIAIMHEGEPYGHLMYSPDQLCRIVGEGFSEVMELLEELEEAGVFSRDEQGLIFSRRMVRDRQQSEVQAEFGRQGGNPSLLKGGLKGRDKPRSQKLESELESERKKKEPAADAPEFLGFWRLFLSVGRPGDSRKAASKAFSKALGEGVAPSAIMGGANRYVARLRHESADKRYTPMAAKWLNGAMWENEPGPAKPAPGTAIVHLHQSSPWNG